MANIEITTPRKFTTDMLPDIPKRHWSETLRDIIGVYILPSDIIHDSGFNCMDFVAEKKDRSLVRFGGGCDDVHFAGEHFRMDCLPRSKIVHIWNSKHTFSISHDLSSIDFIENLE